MKEGGKGIASRKREGRIIERGNEWERRRRKEAVLPLREGPKEKNVVAMFECAGAEGASRKMSRFFFVPPFYPSSEKTDKQRGEGGGGGRK